MAGLTSNNDKHELFILFSRGLCYGTLGNDFHKLKNVVIAGSPRNMVMAGSHQKKIPVINIKHVRFELRCVCGLFRVLFGMCIKNAHFNVLLQK